MIVFGLTEHVINVMYHPFCVYMIEGYIFIVVDAVIYFFSVWCS